MHAVPAIAKVSTTSLHLHNCGDPKEATVPKRVAQTSRSSLSVGESPEVPFDS